jgi:cellulose synthase/poly-beta-1,6-N-acetylglucosamine synthase-like glycosyltransferase
VLTDVRQRLAPDSVRQLVRNFADPSVGTVSGGYFIDSARTSDEADVNRYWRVESWLRDRLAEIDSMLGATGPLYAIRRDLAAPIPPAILLDDMYLPLTAFFKGYRLITDPSAKFYDVPMTVKTEFRRKVRTLAGNYQILKYLPALLTSANRMRWHYLSYKLGRLLLPFVLLAAFISGLFLPAPFNVLVTTAQIACYLVAALDPVVPEQTWLKRLSSPLHTFCVMMAAAVCALSVLVVPPHRLWVVTSTVAPDPS